MTFHRTIDPKPSVKSFSRCGLAAAALLALASGPLPVKDLTDTYTWWASMGGAE